MVVVLFVLGLLVSRVIVIEGLLMIHLIVLVMLDIIIVMLGLILHVSFVVTAYLPVSSVRHPLFVLPVLITLPCLRVSVYA